MMREKSDPRVLICDPIHDEGLVLLQERVDLDIETDLDSEALVTKIPQYDGLIVRSTPVPAELIEHAFRLKIVGVADAFLDEVDVSRAKAKGIEIVYAPDANTMAFAEYTLGLLLAVARRLPWAEAGLREGTWQESRTPGTGLVGKTLGIVGFGRVGRQVAIRAQAFGMKVLVNEISSTPELALEAKVKVVNLAELLTRSDFVSLHVTLTQETVDMIGEAELAQMKPSAYLINTAKARLINEEALLRALDQDQIAGAAVDVVGGGFSPSHPLVVHPRVIATPRIAAFTEDAARSAAIAVAEQFLDYFNTMEIQPILPLRIVPSESVFPHELVDGRRVALLASRLAQAGLLKNPPLVMETENGYMVLDGATRSTAMRQMGLPHMLVQVCTAEAEGLQLNTWHHVIRQLRKTELLDLIQKLPDIDLVATDRESVTEDQIEYGSLCTLHFVDGEIYLVRAKPAVNRLEALNNLTTAYIDASITSRTMNRRIRNLLHEFEDMTALVVFPKYEMDQVIQLAQAGRRVPAGITRFIIPGRVLRVNLSLDILRSDESLRDKNRWLQEHLIKQQKEGHIRYYAEPVYLLDE